MILDRFCKKSPFLKEKIFLTSFFLQKKAKKIKIKTLPEESKDVGCKSQEIWSCLVL
jgi:hypothetical protein